MTSEPGNETSSNAHAFWNHTITAAIIVWLMFLAYSSIRYSFPAVNEPHYLCKAKHFWNPDWCANDFFFQSSNPHYVYYLTIGSLTKFFTLPVTAIIGRLISLGILATGWTLFLRNLFKNHWSILFVTLLFLSFQSISNWSGEWVVGGTESKVISYGFVFGSIGLVIQKRWMSAAICAGLAISFHPIVGIWSLIAVCGTLIILNKSNTDSKTDWKRLVQFLVVTVICSLPGLIPAIALFLQPVDTELTRWVDYTQVFDRLKHHLDPYDFKQKAWIVYGIYLAAWIGIEWNFAGKTDDQENATCHRFFRYYLMFTLLIALCGLLNAFRLGSPEEMPLADLRVKLMKFYPFRLFDLMLPIGLGISIVRLVGSLFKNQKLASNGIVKFILLAAVTLFAIFMPERQPSWFRAPESRRVAWREACNWLRKNTPEDSMVVVPRGNFGFQWYSHRAAYVKRKDCPQDSKGIHEWDQRMNKLQKWREESLTGEDKRYHFEDLNRLREFSKSDFFIVDRPKRKVDGKPLFANEWYRIYDLRNIQDNSGE